MNPEEENGQDALKEVYREGLHELTLRCRDLLELLECGMPEKPGKNTLGLSERRLELFFETLTTGLNDLEGGIKWLAE